MNRIEALEALRPLAHGLAADLAGTARLLERVASQGETAEELRAALVEVGARTLLDSWNDGRRASEAQESRQ